MFSLTAQLKPFVAGFVHGALITFEGQEQGYHSIEEYHRETRKNIASAIQIYFSGHQVVQIVNLTYEPHVAQPINQTIILLTHLAATTFILLSKTPNRPLNDDLRKKIRTGVNYFSLAILFLGTTFLISKGQTARALGQILGSTLT